MSFALIKKLIYRPDKMPSSRKSTVLACAVITAISINCLTSAVRGADVKQALTAAELTDLVREPNVGAKATNLQVVGAGPDVTVMAQSEEASGERDLKIDAIFLAKALFQHAGGQISKVKVLFSQAGHGGRYVSITEKQIGEYGSGKITAEQFLGMLHLSSVEAEKAPDVVQGPQFERRLLVWQRIEKLRQQGTGVTPIEANFAEVETAIKGGNQDESKKLTYLESKLAEQEGLVKQARNAARGLGITAPRASSERFLVSLVFRAGRKDRYRHWRNTFLPIMILSSAVLTLVMMK